MKWQLLVLYVPRFEMCPVCISSPFPQSRNNFLTLNIAARLQAIKRANYK
jgi:hypothetical protein